MRYQYIYVLLEDFTHIGNDIKSVYLM